MPNDMTDPAISPDPAAVPAPAPVPVATAAPAAPPPATQVTHAAAGTEGEDTAGIKDRLTRAKRAGARELLKALGLPEDTDLDTIKTRFTEAEETRKKLLTAEQKQAEAQAAEQAKMERERKRIADERQSIARERQRLEGEKVQAAFAQAAAAAKVRAQAIPDAIARFRSACDAAKADPQRLRTLLDMPAYLATLKQEAGHLFEPDVQPAQTTPREPVVNGAPVTPPPPGKANPKDGDDVMALTDRQFKDRTASKYGASSFM